MPGPVPALWYQVCDGVDLILRQGHVRAQPFPRRVGAFHFGGNLLVYSLHAFLFSREEQLTQGTCAAARFKEVMQGDEIKPPTDT